MTERRKRGDDECWYRYRLKCTTLDGLVAFFEVECDRDASVLDHPKVEELRREFVQIEAVSRTVVRSLGHELDEDFIDS